jgi:hypothetical protein
MEVDTEQPVRRHPHETGEIGPRGGRVRLRTRKIRAPYDLKSHARSRVSNGKEILPQIDGRSLWARRLRELLAAHISDLGGEANISAAELALLRRSVNLICECERREVAFALAGEVTDQQLMVYQTAINCLRRTLECLGLARRERLVDGIDSSSDLALQAYHEALRNGAGTETGE